MSYRPVVPYPGQLHPSIAQPFPTFSTTTSVSLKRPFRHRRKDPSCDACRERKVKCDATGSNPCTECRTRNIKCQFTREHMRRLTSIKQVQDLERKLRNAKMEVVALQSQMQRQRMASLDESDWVESSFRRPLNESDGRNPLRDFNFHRVRDEIIRRSRGLFFVPPAWREPVPDSISEGSVGPYSSKNLFSPKLPPRLLMEHLLRLFKAEVFPVSPFVDLDLLTERATELYESKAERDEHGILLHASRSWLVVFFATLALTAHTVRDEVIMQFYPELSVPIGRDLVDAATFYFGPVTKRNTVDDVRGSLLLAVYYRQLNELGAANIWLGLSCKIAQYLGFHRFSPGLDRKDEIDRANAWWDIYLLDRILAAQQGCEMTISDEDCDLRPPDQLAATDVEPQGRIALQSKFYSWTVLYGRVVRILRDSQFLSEEDIDKLEERIQSHYGKMLRMVALEPDATTPDPGWHLDIHIFVDNTRLRVLRHNLTPHAPFGSRTAALRRCIRLSREASRKIAQRFMDPETADSPEVAEQHNRRVVRIVYPEHCQFVYSCAMYLVVARLWKLTLPLVKALRTIGDKMPISNACCRYLWGLITFMEEKPAISQGGDPWTEAEEEMVAYIAAEMHQDGRAWEAVWHKDPVGVPGLEIPLAEDIGEFEFLSDSEIRPTSKAELDPFAVASPVERRSRTPLPQREDETWDSMVQYVKERSELEEAVETMEEIETAKGTIIHESFSTEAFESTEEAIQRRMSIANLV